MNDDELGEAVARSIGQRVSARAPRLSVDELLTQAQRRLRRQKQRFLVAMVAMLAVGAFAGYLIGHTGDSKPSSSNIVALDDGTPDFGSTSSAIEPSDVTASEIEIGQAFHAALDGGVPPAEQEAATQDGAAVRDLAAKSRKAAERFGYTQEQLDGTTVTVLGTRFIDATHAIVNFSLAVPEHGEVFVDRIGYAIRSDGRWRVALRTICDLLSLNGVGQQCPPVK